MFCNQCKVPLDECAWCRTLGLLAQRGCVSPLCEGCADLLPWIRKVRRWLLCWFDARRIQLAGLRKRQRAKAWA